MKYAVIQDGQKQYLVEEGATIELDKQKSAEGDQIEFNEVPLFVDGENVEVGTPFVSYKVIGKVIKHIKDKKKLGIKYQPGGHRKKFGHRQSKTLVEITSIEKTK